MSDVFEVLADPTRRRIVEALASGETAVGELVDRAQIHQSGVSRHLRILHEAGFVDARADGQKRYYSLKADRFRELDQWVAKYRSLWEDRFDHFEAALAKRTEARLRRKR